ncbi:MAG TPA: WG repeat-containing protein [Aequorivita sp.]|nr:WG repeat-containing protein [Aequorivita sp.]
MILQINIQSKFTRSLLLLYVLSCLFTACTNISGKNESNTAFDPSTQPIPEKIIEAHEGVALNNPFVIAEQDPDGVFWGLRETLSSKLILGYTYQNIWEFRDGFAIVQLNGKFGLIDKTGKEIIEPTYSYPKTEMKCGFIAFEIGYGPTLIFDSTGKSLMPMVYGMTGFLPCEERVTYGHNKYGMLNFNRDTILPFKFKSAYLFPEGFCAASLADQTGYNSLYGLYDLDGNQILPHVFEYVDGFYSGRAIVKKNGKYGIIDETGKELFYTNYGRIDRFYNDYAIVYTKPENGEIKVGIIDKNGHEVVPAIYQWLEHVYNFSEGMAAMAQNRKYGFVDTTGKVVVPFKYDKVESFINGIAKVWVGWRYVGYINRKGEEIIPADFEAMDQANLRRYHNKYIIGLRDSIYHVFDYSGKEIDSLNYERVGEFDANDKSFLVSTNGKWGSLDSNFQVKIPIEYESLEIIFPDKIAASQNNKIGIIDREGKAISSFIFDWIAPFQDRYMNGLALVGIGEKTGLINGYGNLIIPAEYDEIGEFSYGLAIVRKNDKYGFANLKGREIVPTIYDKIEPFNGFSAEVTLKGETYLIDGSGHRIIQEY